MKLNLPEQAVSDRVSLKRKLEAGEKFTYAHLDGPGCIRHIWVTMTRKELTNRQLIIRIFFDDEPIPYVEAPVGDFFGVMHGKTWYPVNTPYLSVQMESGYNCYFEMPFAKSARIEFEAGEQSHGVYIMVNWHRYPGQELQETRRFCARWRREMPTERYGDDYLMLDADGPGQLLGFVYGVRLIDNVDRWSHGGADNIYIDGEGEHPAYLRGIGGEDTFGTSYGGALHDPETHLYAGMPYYRHDDVGEARPAQRVVGYRFFEKDSIQFRESLHMRFGCMCNDICSTVYWYSEQPVRPFFSMPGWKQLQPGKELPKGEQDMPLPESGHWWLCGPYFNEDDRAMEGELPAEREFHPEQDYDGLHDEGSFWVTEGSKSLGRDRARWVRRNASHGFIDFNHVFRPWRKGVAPNCSGAAIARCVLHAPADMTAMIRLAWEDQLTLQVNGEKAYMGQHLAFRSKIVKVQLREGANVVQIKQSNEISFNHGGWVFAFKAEAEDGTVLVPQLD